MIVVHSTLSQFLVTVSPEVVLSLSAWNRIEAAAGRKTCYIQLSAGSPETELHLIRYSRTVAWSPGGTFKDMDNGLSACIEQMPAMIRARLHAEGYTVYPGMCVLPADSTVFKGYFDCVTLTQGADGEYSIALRYGDEWTDLMLSVRRDWTREG